MTRWDQDEATGGLMLHQIDDAKAKAVLIGIPIAEDPPRSPADPAMWVVKDADSTVYLLGTIHVMKPGVKWRSDKLDAALKISDEYWMDADVIQDPLPREVEGCEPGYQACRQCDGWHANE